MRFRRFDSIQSDGFDRSRWIGAPTKWIGQRRRRRVKRDRRRDNEKQSKSSKRERWFEIRAASRGVASSWFAFKLASRPAAARDPAAREESHVSVTSLHLHDREQPACEYASTSVSSRCWLIRDSARAARRNFDVAAQAPRVRRRTHVLLICDTSSDCLKLDQPVSVPCPPLVRSFPGRTGRIPSGDRSGSRARARACLRSCNYNVASVISRPHGSKYAKYFARASSDAYVCIYRVYMACAGFSGRRRGENLFDH